MQKVVFIGAGRVGTALAVHLARRGYPVLAVASRSRGSVDRFCVRLAAEGAWPEAVAGPVEAARRGEAVFITTPDQAIGEVMANLAAAGSFRPGQVVIHTSGALSSDILRPASDCGAATLSFHPLQSFATVERGIELLPGSTVVLDGDSAGLEFGRELVAVFGGQALTIPSATKPLYHAAACLASNYLVTVLGLSLGLLARCGLPASDALRALMPLVRGTVENVAAVGIPAALTGPVERGDIEVLRGHLAAIARSAPHVDTVYRLLGAETARLAATKGRLEGPELAAMLNLFYGGESDERARNRFHLEQNEGSTQENNGPDRL